MADLKATLKALEGLAYRKKFSKFEFFEPYPKQKEFFLSGVSHIERLLCAGNQLGKTIAAAFEVSCHLTGIYPDWWEGRKWTRPIHAAAAGESALVVRNVQQKYLCGTPGVDSEFGTGMIPKHLFLDKPSLSRGVTDAYDMIQVRHASGGVSTLTFMSYEQGRSKFQGTTLDLIWDDEEIPLDIYVEQLTRLSATGGMIMTTFTPMSGSTEVYELFRLKQIPSRKMILMTVEDAPHMTPERIQQLKDQYPVYQHKTRLYGVPMAGEGAVFPLDEDSLKEPPITAIPEHWYKIWGIDFGIGHPFAAVLVLEDRDTGCVHVHSTVRLQGEGTQYTPLQHAVPMKAIAANVPVAWPQDGTARESSGKTLASQYKEQGLRMLPEHATWPEGGYSTEAGISMMLDLMTTGKFKVASHLSMWFEEFRGYHRKDRKIVKEKDDLMSATRVALMMLRHAKQVALGSKASSRKPVAYIAEGTLDLGMDD